ncbi:hypothetical protein A359_00470 [secondary endosymbiont of Ctenarytaina eucalypti]|uniref:Uncharacterized protein n=1 Tax=secondary endosymbiont of Ctenarytaina eucalypti TaxID=1199245 RepID=J3Z2N5_9ENTR|nr:hypothetical protein A359_00470 [secondary endosymbiont of Ctenarytaina eucalypti]
MQALSRHLLPGVLIVDTFKFRATSNPLMASLTQEMLMKINHAPRKKGCSGAVGGVASSSQDFCMPIADDTDTLLYANAVSKIAPSNRSFTFAAGCNPFHM